jgi:S-adenosyl methyltransferase
MPPRPTWRGCGTTWSAGGTTSRLTARARALVLSRPEGVVSYLHADAREPAAIIDAARHTLDLGQPAAIVMIGILNFIEGPGLVAAVLRALIAALSRGSYLEVASWLTGLSLVAPGIVEVHQWRPDQGDPSYPLGIPVYGAVGRKS